MPSYLRVHRIDSVSWWHSGWFCLPALVTAIYCLFAIVAVRWIEMTGREGFFIYSVSHDEEYEPRLHLMGACKQCPVRQPLPGWAWGC